MIDTSALLLDIGNTRLKWGVYKDGRIGRSGSVTHESLRETSFAALTTKLPRSFARVLASNVAGASFATRLSGAIGLHCNNDIRFVFSIKSVGTVSMESPRKSFTCDEKMITAIPLVNPTISG
jgi:pantothenate kinase type III